MARGQSSAANAQGLLFGSRTASSKEPKLPALELETNGLQGSAYVLYELIARGQQDKVATELTHYARTVLVKEESPVRLWLEADIQTALVEAALEMGSVLLGREKFQEEERFKRNFSFDGTIKQEQREFMLISELVSRAGLKTLSPAPASLVEALSYRELAGSLGLFSTLVTEHSWKREFPYGLRPTVLGSDFRDSIVEGITTGIMQHAQAVQGRIEGQTPPIWQYISLVESLDLKLSRHDYIKCQKDGVSVFHILKPGTRESFCNTTSDSYLRQSTWEFNSSFQCSKCSAHYKPISFQTKPYDPEGFFTDVDDVHRQMLALVKDQIEALLDSQTRAASFGKLLEQQSLLLSKAAANEVMLANSPSEIWRKLGIDAAKAPLLSADFLAEILRARGTGDKFIIRQAHVQAAKDKAKELCFVDSDSVERI